jgi:hypothetical protein
VTTEQAIRFWRLRWLMPLVACCGCGLSGPSYTMLSVEGLVTLEGSPLVAAEVMFDSVDGPRGFGVTDDNGRFSVTTRQYGPGLPEGRYRVFVSATEDTQLAGSSDPVEIDVMYQETGVGKVTIDAETDLIVFDLEDRPPEANGGRRVDDGGGA